MGFRDSSVSAKQAFEIHQAKSAELLKAITEKVNQNWGEDINWCQVGDMGYTREKLETIAEFFNIKID